MSLLPFFQRTTKRTWLIHRRQSQGPVPYPRSKTWRTFRPHRSAALLNKTSCCCLCCPLTPFSRLHQRMATTWGTPLLPTSNRLSHSNPRTLTGRPGRLKTPGRLRASRRTRLERTEHNPSSLTLSGFSKTLLSQMHSGVSPRCSISFRLFSACSHSTSSITSDSHHGTG